MDIKSAKWRSRRGMLELDLMLQPFVQQHLTELDDALQDLYWALLEEEDQSLWRWLLGIEAPPSQYEALINIIKNSS